ncbi:MAG TPA: GNAT family N-acetyltransferase, partial [Actinomycetota bacterium]|nr:GNAT family N-acetyltransferase [Actinomycetota bacterium]
MERTATGPAVTIRPFAAGDEAAVLELLGQTLGGGPAGWRPPEFFRWKHQDNPFGRSLLLLAEADGRIVGLRAFMRWRFVADGRDYPAVRAVDTATHPDYQGRGIFSLLTRQALHELRADGVAFVFNTPNDRSRPGYLKMGWQLVERLPVAATPRSPRALLRLARARTPADKWSAPTTAGVPVADVLADDTGVKELLEVSRAEGD